MCWQVLEGIVVGKNEWATNNEKKYEQATATPPNLEKPARKVGGEAANFWYHLVNVAGVKLARAYLFWMFLQNATEFFSTTVYVVYCRRTEFVSILQKPREKLCASEFHPSKT